MIAPTQHGKSTLKRRLFRGLAPAIKRGEATVIDSDPKGADHDAMVEDCAALGLENVTYILNSSRRGHVPCIRPWSGDNPEQDAMDFLELGLSLFQDENFLDQPQRYRWLFNSSLPVIAQGGTLYDIAMMLADNGSATRHRFLGDFQHPLIQQDWDFFKSMTRSLRQQATQSAYVWMANLWSQPLLRHVFAPLPTALDIEAFVQRGGVFLEAIPEQRPLSRQSCAFLRSFLRHKFIKAGFRIPKEERPHLFFLLDEAQLAITGRRGRTPRRGLKSRGGAELFRYFVMPYFWPDRERESRIACQCPHQRTAKNFWRRPQYSRYAYARRGGVYRVL